MEHEQNNDDQAGGFDHNPSSIAPATVNPGAEHDVASKADCAANADCDIAKGVRAAAGQMSNISTEMRSVSAAMKVVASEMQIEWRMAEKWTVGINILTFAVLIVAAFIYMGQLDQMTTQTELLGVQMAALPKILSKPAKGLRGN